MKHILIVEDDTILNETLSFNLQQKGYITQSAQNQKEALIKLKSVLFDAVLLDVSLPDGNGFSICRNIRQTINLNTAIIFLTADDIEQDILIFNILDNSIKYTPTNGEISISIFNTEDQLGICISDTGIGISKYNLNNIFNRFWRENRIVTDGNGLGLYLFKEIISLHDGYIIVESEKTAALPPKFFFHFIIINKNYR